MAARRACTTAGDAGGRRHGRRIAAALRAAIAGFQAGLKESGYVEGQNVAIEYRFAEGQFDRLPAFASDLVRRQVAVIFASTSAAVRAAKQASATTPIVFSLGEDPLKLGLVASLSRPGGNMTGTYQFTTGLEAKRLGLLHEMVPKATTVAALVQPNFSAAETQLRDVREAATSLGVQLVVLRASVEGELNAAFATLTQQRAGALLVCARPSSTADASSLSCWQRAMRCQRSTNGASSPWPAAS